MQQLLSLKALIVAVAVLALTGRAVMAACCPGVSAQEAAPADLQGEFATPAAMADAGQCPHAHGAHEGAEETAFDAAGDACSEDCSTGCLSAPASVSPATSPGREADASLAADPAEVSAVLPGPAARQATWRARSPLPQRVSAAGPAKHGLLLLTLRLRL